MLFRLHYFFDYKRRRDPSFINGNHKSVNNKIDRPRAINNGYFISDCQCEKGHRVVDFSDAYLCSQPLEIIIIIIR